MGTFDVLKPDEIEQAIEAAGIKKTGMPPGKMIILGILAGVFIGIGGLMLGLVLSETELPFIVARILGGVSFCVGLLLVVAAGAELFTGNNLIIMAVLSRKVTWKAYAKNLTIILLCNFIGALIAVAILFLADVGSINGGATADAFIKLAAAKVSIPPLTLFFKAVFCNFMVCLAIWLATAGRSLFDKLIGILFPITTFIVAGGEHSIANMFLIPMGFIQAYAGNATSELAIAAGEAISIGGIFYNFGLAILGNLVGGAVMVGVVYWFAFHKKGEKGEGE